MNLMDIVDTILGPLDLIDRIGASLSVAARRDRGVELRVLRKDKRGTHTGAEARTLLARYGVRAHRGRFDATYQYIIVGRRQADWARYLLQRAGVATNATGSQAAPAGTMPKPWSAQ